MEQEIGNWSALLQEDAELNALLNRGIAPLLVQQNDFTAVVRALGYESVDALAIHLGWRTREDALRFFTGSAEGEATAEQALVALGRFYRLKQRLRDPQQSTTPDSL
ncbi:MAG: hypothetical protein HY340_00055 [Candidatus Kerfeldbacteria bacterium]|nr:hypothetical protein [Candidatus Kerfeldbacteria bacterium]